MTFCPRPTLALLTAACLAAAPAPALANIVADAPSEPAPAADPTPTPAPSTEASPAAPWWPSLVMVGTYLTAAKIGEGLVEAGGNPAANVYVVPVALAISWSSGYIAAGDPWRGLGAAALGYPLMLAGAFAGSALNVALAPHPNPAHNTGLGGGILGFVATGVIYTGLVAWDANQTAARVARERAATGTPKP